MEDYLTGHWKARLLVEEGRVQTEFVATLYEDKTDTGQVGRLDRPRTTLCSHDGRIDALAGKCLGCNALPVRNSKARRFCPCVEFLCFAWPHRSQQSAFYVYVQYNTMQQRSPASEEAGCSVVISLGCFIPSSSGWALTLEQETDATNWRTFIQTDVSERFSDQQTCLNRKPFIPT